MPAYFFFFYDYARFRLQNYDYINDVSLIKNLEVSMFWKVMHLFIQKTVSLIIKGYCISKTTYCENEQSNKKRKIL